MIGRDKGRKQVKWQDGSDDVRCGRVVGSSGKACRVARQYLYSYLILDQEFDTLDRSRGSFRDSGGNTTHCNTMSALHRDCAEAACWTSKVKLWMFLRKRMDIRKEDGGVLKKSTTKPGILGKRQVSSILVIGITACDSNATAHKASSPVEQLQKMNQASW